MGQVKTDADVAMELTADIEGLTAALAQTRLELEMSKKPATKPRKASAPTTGLRKPNAEGLWFFLGRYKGCKEKHTQVRQVFFLFGKKKDTMLVTEDGYESVNNLSGLWWKANPPWETGEVEWPPKKPEKKSG